MLDLESRSCEDLLLQFVRLARGRLHFHAEDRTSRDDLSRIDTSLVNGQIIGDEASPGSDHLQDIAAQHAAETSLVLANLNHGIEQV